MANTDIDAVKKKKNAERNKQYRLKHKLLMQRQASTSKEKELAEKQKKAEYDKQYRMKLSSLKMKGIRLLFYY
jgi:hypothetical protein